MNKIKEVWSNLDEDWKVLITLPIIIITIAVIAFYLITRNYCGNVENYVENERFIIQCPRQYARFEHIRLTLEGIDNK